MRGQGNKSHLCEEAPCQTVASGSTANTTVTRERRGRTEKPPSGQETSPTSASHYRRLWEAQRFRSGQEEVISGCGWFPRGGGHRQGPGRGQGVMCEGQQQAQVRELSCCTLHFLKVPTFRWVWIQNRRVFPADSNARYIVAKAETSDQDQDVSR